MIIATWNIGGGILGDSHQIDGTEDIAYHCDFVRTAAPDILCLQEAHSYPDKVSNVEQIAKAAGYAYFKNAPHSQSHLAKDAQFSLGIVSKYPITAHDYTAFPNPALEAEGPNGQHWVLTDKAFTKSVLETPSGSVTVFNAHFFPLHYFNADATEPRFRHIYELFEAQLLAAAKTGPVVACIDLNDPRLAELLPGISGTFTSAFTEPTTPKGIQQDFILVNDAFTLEDAQVTKTQADHHYCSVTLESK